MRSWRLQLRFSRMGEGTEGGGAASPAGWAAPWSQAPGGEDLLAGVRRQDVRCREVAQCLMLMYALQPPPAVASPAFLAAFAEVLSGGDRLGDCPPAPLLAELRELLRQTLAGPEGEDPFVGWGRAQGAPSPETAFPAPRTVSQLEGQLTSELRHLNALRAEAHRCGAPALHRLDRQERRAEAV